MVAALVSAVDGHVLVGWLALKWLRPGASPEEVHVPVYVSQIVKVASMC